MSIMFFYNSTPIRKNDLLKSILRHFKKCFNIKVWFKYFNVLKSIFDKLFNMLNYSKIYNINMRCLHHKTLIF